MKQSQIFLSVAVLLSSVLSATDLSAAALGNTYPEPSINEQLSKAVIISKPEPHYPTEARNAGFEGTIVLRAIFRSTGKVTDIKFAKVIPENTPQDLVKKLSDECIRVAGKIKFQPAIKDGHPVSMYVQLEYNFHLE